MPDSLTSRHPELSVSDLLEEFAPPPHFAHERFATYRPDPSQPTQADRKSTRLNSSH